MATVRSFRERLEEACKEDLKKLSTRLKAYQKLRKRAGDMEEREDIDFIVRMLRENLAKYEKIIGS